MPHVKTQRVLMEFSKVHRWHAFVASRTEKMYKKKVAKKGAGRELPMRRRTQLFSRSWTQRE